MPEGSYTNHVLPRGANSNSTNSTPSTQSVKIVFNDYTVKEDIMNKKTDLKTHLESDPAAFSTIFINNDVSKLTRQENNRLGYKKRSLKRQFPEEEIHIKEGKLYQNGRIIDQFNLSNQVFPISRD